MAEGDAERDETPAEKMDRNWDELLQELRVTQTGVQILTGFLLTLPFQQRFSGLDDRERLLFLASILLGTAATAMLVAPVSGHRILFRKHEKDVLVSMGNVFAKVGLALLALAVTTVLTMIFDVVVGRTAGLVVAVVLVAFFVLAWLVVPLLALRAAKRRVRG
ncbi:MAG TPA: DUF6328 family protein [Dermatophilaceae bacterium]|nr:DUF6328 family protein [Dermatophilaceae bacterium]